MCSCSLAVACSAMNENVVFIVHCLALQSVCILISYLVAEHCIWWRMIDLFQIAPKHSTSSEHNTVLKGNNRAQRLESQNTTQHKIQYTKTKPKTQHSTKHNTAQNTTQHIILNTNTKPKTHHSTKHNTAQSATTSNVWRGLKSALLVCSKFITMKDFVKK